MKKRVFVTLIMLIAGCTVFAQTEKGNWILSGLNLISFQTGNDKYSGGSYEMESTFTSLSIGPSFFSENFGEGSMPTLSYGFTDQIFGGISLMLTSTSEKDKEDNDKSTSSIFMIGPSVRCFIMKEKEFLPFVEGKAGFGSFKSGYGDSESDKSTLSGWYLGTGATYFFSQNAGIDFTLGYQKFTAKAKDSDTDGKGTNAGIFLGVGIALAF